MNGQLHSMDIRTVQQAMLKQAGLFGNTMLGRGLNDLVGHDTFVGRIFGASPEQEAEDFFRSQEAPGEREARRRAAAEYDARQAASNAHIDRGLVAANRRLAAGAGVTQRRQVAQLAPKPAAQSVPRVLSNTERQMQQYRAKEDQAATTQRGNQLMAQQFARQRMSPYVSQQQIAESQRQTAQDKAMVQKQREIYGKPKRAPGIYNAQGQRWNGKAFV